MTERFWEKVEKRDGCWLWIGNKVGLGYGKIYMDGRLYYTHRLSYVMVHGPIPAGLFVLHRCDVPSCVNPDHLFLGTRADNQADMAAKGRSARGSRNGAAKLTETIAREIRTRFEQGGLTKRQLGREYGVSEMIPGLIARGKIWKHAV